MHGIKVGIFHRLTRAAQCSRSFVKSCPGCEGVALASVTFHLRGLDNVATEWTLTALAYNCRRIVRL